jgi:hypothetical protein
MNETNAVHSSGDRSRPGCSSARPRAEHRGAHQHETVRRFHATKSAARARLIAPGAGALPVSAEAFGTRRVYRRFCADELF